jgi:hypothetical protein
MENFSALSPQRLFDLGARLASLEGYLYAGDKVHKTTCPTG